MYWYEFIGYAASFFIALSLMMKNLLRLRIINSVGAFCFVVYGALIASWPVAGMNAFIILVNIYYLRKLFNNKKEFNFVYSEGSKDNIIQHFLLKYKEDINSIFKSFKPEEIAQYNSYIILNELKIIGLFVFTREEERIYVELDYVIPEYRDFQPAMNFYNSTKSKFSSKGVEIICARPENTNHEKYLTKIGFRKENDKLYLLPVKNLN